MYKVEINNSPISKIKKVPMFKARKNLRRSNSITTIKEVYQDHPCMLRVNALKEQLKQEKLQDKAFCQSIKPRKAIHQ